jgi:hypothetical protein
MHFYFGGDIANLRNRTVRTRENRGITVYDSVSEVPELAARFENNK